MYNFDKIINRENSHSVKYDLRGEHFGKTDVIPMWVADMDFETPHFIRDAIKQRAEHPIYGYSIKPNSYYHSIKNWLQTEHQWEVNKNDICFSPGVVPGIALAITAFTEPEDQIMVQPPVYFPFFISVEENNRKLIHNQLIEENNNYNIDFKDLEVKLSDPKTKMLIISNPHNPVGRVWEKDELNKMVDLCHKHQVLILSDEIHSDLILHGHQHHVLANLSEKAKDISITFMAPSKTFNMAGLSTSFLVIQNQALNKQYVKTIEGYHLNIGNVFGNVALEAAYTHGKAWLNELISYLEQNIETVDVFLKEHLPQITFNKPQATYLLWLNCKELGWSDDELSEFFIQEASLGLNKGSIFGLGGSGYMRMNIACPLSTLTQALKQLERAISKNNNK